MYEFKIGLGVYTMKKIGILTFHKSINYGSVLQAYALQNILIKLGYAVEIIDYEPDNYKYLYGFFRIPKNKIDVKYDIINLCVCRILIRRRRLFTEFRNKNLHLSKNSYRYGESLDEMDRLYDAVIVGSDQIWNPRAKDSDINFFLPFLKNASKVSYAVSLNDGFLDDVQNQEKIKECLMDFESISTRENSGKKNVERFLDYKQFVQVVLDPTLLHSKEDYLKICASVPVKEPYIFFYSVFHCQESVEAVEILSKRAGMPVYTLFTNYQSHGTMRHHKEIKFIQKNISPSDFISLIANADYVVTDSFHGTAFSIIFEKNFYSIGKTSGKKEKFRDERICGLLDTLKLDNRYISKYEIENIDITETIDYRQVNTLREILINKSTAFLKNALDRGDYR